jgi:hypothetical protein
MVFATGTLLEHLFRLGLILLHLELIIIVFLFPLFVLSAFHALMGFGVALSAMAAQESAAICTLGLTTRTLRSLGLEKKVFAVDPGTMKSCLRTTEVGLRQGIIVGAKLIWRKHRLDIVIRNAIATPTVARCEANVVGVSDFAVNPKKKASLTNIKAMTLCAAVVWQIRMKAIVAEDTCFGFRSGYSFSPFSDFHLLQQHLLFKIFPQPESNYLLDAAKCTFARLYIFAKPFGGGAIRLAYAIIVSSANTNNLVSSTPLFADA